MSVTSGAVKVVALKSPFKLERDIRDVEPGHTIAEIFEIVGVDPILARHAHVYVGEHFIPRENWARLKPAPGTQLSVRAFLPPTGGGGGSGGSGGKDILRTVLIIAVAAGALFLGPALGAAIGLTGALAASVGQAIIGIGGMLLVNALVPPRTAATTSNGIAQTDNASPTKFIESARNRANPFGAVPVIFGKHRVVPLYGVNPITEIVGDDQYLRMLFVWGIGPVSIDTASLKIGETLLSNFSDYQINHYSGYDSDTDPVLISAVVDQQNFQILLQSVDGYTIRTTSSDADEISIDWVFSEGLITVTADGTRAAASVIVELEYSVHGAGIWNNIPVAGAVTTFPLSWTNQSAGSFSRITFTQQNTAAIRHGLTFKTASRNTYDVRIKRVTTDTAVDTIRDLILWTALRRITNEAPIQSPVPVAMSELRIRATDQLNGVIDQLSGVITMVADDWTGAAWVERASQNPAAAFRLALQGAATQTPKTDDQLDLDTLEYWSEFCVTNGFHFNQVRDFYSSQWDLLQDIAAAGRASPTIIDGKYSVVIDEAKSPVSYITPRNSVGFKFAKAFIDQPHAFRVQFNNEEQDYSNDEVRVYLNGYNVATATKFETIDFPGVTKPSEIIRHTRFNAAVAIHRPETWTFQQDMERLVYRRGDVVRITHDVLLVGLGQGRITAITIDGSSNVTGLTSDEQIIMAAGNNYGVSIRTANDSVAVSGQIVTVDGEHNSITFVVAIPAAAGVAVGDLFGYGLLGAETDDGLVIGIEPNRNDNLSAMITAVPYRPIVYDIDNEAIPPFSSNLTPIDAVPAVTILQIRSDETVLTVGAGNALDVHIAVKVLALEHQDGALEAQIRTSLTGEPFLDAQIDGVRGNEISIGNVRTGEYVDMRFRWKVPGRVPGVWSYQYNYLVIGKSTSPDPLTGMTISTFGAQAFIRWDKPPELDVQFGGTVRFRHSEDLSPVWGNSVSIGDAAQARTLLATLPLKPGTYLARVFDSSGNYSDVSSVNTKQASVLTFANVSSITESPIFGGTVSGLVVDTINGQRMLFIDGLGSFDAIPDLDAATEIDAYGGVGSTGTYQFLLGFDFTTVKKIRLTTTIASFNAAIFDLIDGWLEPIDDRADFDGTNTADCDCVVYVSLTDNDPASGGATWTAYQRLDSMEIEARGARFRAVLTSVNTDFNIFVSTLGIIADQVT